MIALVLGAALTASTASPTVVQGETLRDWALARCIARGGSGPFARDAAASAAALLERGDYGIETYEAIEALVGRALAQRRGGSVPSGYVTLKCIDLYHSAALQQLIRRQKATPVR